MRSRRQLGVLFKNAEVFERAHGVDTVVFDKTGTLTRGAMTLAEVEATDDPDDFLRLIGSVESGGEHPIARAVVLGSERNATIDLLAVEDFTAVEGKGATGTVDGHLVVVGRPSLFEEGSDIAVSMTGPGVSPRSWRPGTAFLAGWDGEVRGLLNVADTVRAPRHKPSRGSTTKVSPRRC